MVPVCAKSASAPSQIFWQAAVLNFPLFYTYSLSSQTVNEIVSLSSLADEFQRLVNPLDVDSGFKSFRTMPQHDGSPHVECVNGKFHFVVTERGTEFERIRDLSASDVLYLLFDGVTQHMATTYELQNRKQGIDGRSVWFPYQEDLMRKLSPIWGERLKAEHERILVEHPFRP
jgi:hypothetical protein